MINPSGNAARGEQGGVSAKEDAALLAVIECFEKAADGHASSAAPPPEDERRNRRLSAWRERFTRAPSAEPMLVPRTASVDSRLSRVRHALTRLCDMGLRRNDQKIYSVSKRGFEQH